MTAPALVRAASVTLVALLVACERPAPPPAAGPGAPAPTSAPAPAAPAAPGAPGAPVEPAPPAGAPEAASLTGIVSTGGGYYVEFRTDPDPVPLNELFSIVLSVHEADARDEPVEDIELMVDGRMPAHRHGMTREPRIERQPDGTFIVTGMLFHMPGDWVLHFDITRDGTTERAQADVVLE